MHGDPVQVLGNKLRVGDRAPDFDVVDTSLKHVGNGDFAGATRVYVAVPSLDTPVCATETRRFNKEATTLGDVKVVVISMDLPFAQKRWCGAEGVKNVTVLSDYQNASFGENYGLLMKGLRLLARAVVVVDASDRISYIQVVNEVTTEPDYQAALDAVKAATRK
jgi:thiol peroxidase